MKIRLRVIGYALFLLLLLLSLLLTFFVTQVGGSISTVKLYAHSETTTIGGVNYYLHKLSSADGPATTLSASAATTGRKLMGRWVYSLNGIVSISASAWTVTYRALKSSSATSVAAHCDVDILIRKSDNTIRTTITTNAANSPSITLVNTWQTLTGTYNWAAYTVLDQTDYLEVAYYIEVTTAQSSKSVRLLVDDSTLPLADQTKVENVIFTYPNQAPVASFTFSPSNPLIYDVVTFDASASYDPDGSIISYRWDFGDGNVTTVTNPIITHVYSTAASTVNYTVTLTVTDNEGSTGFATQIVPVTNPSILDISLPAGEYKGPNPDHWLSQCWLLNITGLSGTFTIRIDNIHSTIMSYDTHLIIALNDTAYQYLDSLTIDSTPIPKSSFTSGTPTPYGLTPSWEEDVYPTWFSDIYNGVGTIDPRSYKDVQVSVTFTSAAGVAMHFDAYGCTDPVPPLPTKVGHVTHNPHEEDSTVLFSPAAVVQYYLTVTSPYGIVSGAGWYDANAIAYADVDTDIFDHGNGTRRVFLYWSGDASGTNYAQSDPILMNSNKTAIAVWKTQYYLTVTSPYGTPTGADWYDSNTNAHAGLDTGVVNHGNGTRHVFTNWAGDASGTDYASSDPIMMDGPKTAIAVWKTQHFLTVTSPYGIVSGADWYDADTTAYADVDTGVVDYGNGTRRLFTNWSGDASGTDYAQSDPIFMDAPKTAIANWKTQYRLIVQTNGLGTYVTYVYNDTTILGTATDATSYIGWFDDGDLILLNIDSPIVDGSKRFMFTQWSGDAGGTSRPASVTMSAAKDITANYKTQYQINVAASPPGAVGGTFKVTYTQCGTTYTNVERATPWTEWVDANTDVTVSTPQEYVPSELGSGGVRYMFDHYDPSASVTMTEAKTITLVYKTQYYLTVTSPYGTPGGQGWYNVTDTAYATVTPLIEPGPAGVRYVFTHWSGDASGFTSPSNPITMDGPKHAIANWKTQYQITVTANPSGAIGGTFKVTYTQCGTTYTNVQKTTAWTDWVDNNTAVTVSEPQATINGYNFDHYDPSASVTMDQSKTITLIYEIPPLSASISPATKRIKIGESVTFTSSKSGGKSPYNYQWYLNGSAVSGANADTWTFTPTALQPLGNYTVYLIVTDGAANSAKSNEALVTVAAQLKVSISPTSKSILVGQSVDFTSDISGGYPQYHCQWYLNESAVSGANAATWTFVPATNGTYYVYLKVTDDNNNVAQSDSAKIIVVTIPRGGYSVSLTKSVSNLPLICYSLLLASFVAVISLIRRKRK